MNFTHLSVHSKASMLYGSADVKDIVTRVKELGQTSIALTDYCNLYNAIEFYRQAKAAGVKPILGVDLLFCEDCEQLRIQKVRHVSHIILLAENDIGWRNITRLVSESSNEDNYYYNPRVDFKLLEKYKEGVICLTGGSIDGVISKHLYDKQSEDGQDVEPAAIFKAEGLVRRFLKIYDTSHFYLEVQSTGLTEQEQINTRLRSIGLKYGLSLVATGNVHYVNQHDAESHKTLLAMSENSYSKSTFTNFAHEEFYIKSREQLLESGFQESELDTSLEIAARCNVDIDINKRRLPRYAFVPSGKSAQEYLFELANDGLLRIPKSGGTPQDYQARLDRELNDIHEMGFDDYFLIVHDVVSWIHNQGILLGRGRGSAGGSLVSYCLGITDIDPLQYGLIWERFLNKGRGGLPDIDTDVPRSKRQKVLDYIRTRFGARNVAQLVTFNGLQARAVLKEVFRVYDMPFDEANKITALVPAKNDEHVAISLDEAINSVKELKEYSEKYKPWFTIARALEGSYKSTGIHAAAVVISDVPFDESAYPLARSKDGDPIFGWDMNTVDTLSLLKLDILGLNTLDDIQMTMDLVRERRNIEVSRATIPLDDPVTYAMIGNGFTVGVFQIEKQLGKTWSKNLKPENIEQLSDLVSLIRPGPMESNMHTQYRDVKNGSEPLYIHPSLEPVLNNTYSALLYQEQVIDICRLLAGMSLIDADKVRKAMGKKKPEEMKKWQEVFTSGCSKNGIDYDISIAIWGYIEKFAGYGFNKSHGIGYALMAYETAYLKANYPIEFLCAKLTNSDGDAEKLSGLIYDAKIFDIEVTPPRVRQGNKNFAVVNDKQIAFGLTALKGVGVAAISDMLKLANGLNTFDEILWQWVMTKSKVNSATMASLIKGGAFDDVLENRVRGVAKLKLISEMTEKETECIKTLMQAEPEILDWVRFIKAVADDARCVEIKTKYNVAIPNVRRRETIRDLLKEYDAGELFDSKSQRIVWEQFYLGISLSGSEADVYKARHKCVDLVKNSSADMRFEIAVCVDGVREIVTKKGDPMAFVTARDNTYQMDNIVVFPKTFALCKGLLESGNVIRIRGKVDDRGSLIADIVERLK
jgi:DNA polymerase-3 subunit alpha